MSFMKFDPDALTARHPATGDEKYLCSWRTARDGAHAKFWEPASLALAHLGNLGDTLKDLRASQRLRAQGHTVILIADDADRLNAAVDWLETLA